MIEQFTNISIILFTIFPFQINDLKVFLQRWRDVTEREFPELLHLLPSPDGVDLNKLAGGAAMTDTCNGARKTNRMTCEDVNGVVHSLYCHNHLRNVWVKNVLESLTSYLKDHLHDSLDEIAPELRVSPSFNSFARAFDKMFSLCANYPKGYGELFRQWMKENHAGELLLHVERAAGGRQDVNSMAALAMFWNRNYCLEFMADILRFGGKRKDNILLNNLFVMQSSVEMISVTRLWSIFHIAIIMPMRWLAAKTHELAEYNWGVISLGWVLDKLKLDLEAIVEDPQLIHDEEFMMGMMDEWAEELPPFKEYLTRQFEKKKTSYFASTRAKAVPLKELRKELFHPSDEDNKDSTSMLEIVAVIASKAWVKELLDESKATFPFMSVSKSEYSWEYCSAEVKEALLGIMAVNDLAESSFAGVTAQVQVFGRIDLASAAAISDINRNGFLDRSPIDDDTATGMFHGLREELQLTAVMCAMEFAPATRQANNDALEAQRRAKRQKEEIVKQLGLEKATDEHIECLIYHKMYESDRCWKTREEVTEGLKALRFKKDK